MKFTFAQLGMALAVLGLVPASALAQGQQQFGAPNQYVTQRTSPPNGTSIDVQYVTSGLPASWSAAVTQAAAIWNAAGANVHLVTTSAPTVININDVNGQPVDRTIGTTLGAGSYPDGRAWNHITSATIEFNTGSGNWHTDITTAPNGGERDLLTYLIREFGFALGLGAAGPGDLASVMLGGGSNPANGSANRVLSPGDIRALQTIYGSPEPATWALFGVGLAALGATRRSRRAKA